MSESIVKAIHVYEHEARKFEESVNLALAQIVEVDGVIDDVKYTVDASTDANRRGGFGALLLYEVPAPR